jgi:ribonuclease VapC
MIVVDASSLVAIGGGEPDADAHLTALRADEAVMSSINYVEAGIILIGRDRIGGKPRYDEWLASLGVKIRAADDLSEGALRAYLMYGRGYHRARLNLADCFAYALAKELDAPLLYKGNDFLLTDIRPALQPT